MSAIDFDAQIACIKRELGFRARCYAQWVASKRMSQAKADHEIAAMKAVLQTLERCARSVQLPHDLLDSRRARDNERAEDEAACKTLGPDGEWIYG